MNMKIRWRKFCGEGPKYGTTILFYSTKNPAGTFGTFGIIKWHEKCIYGIDLKVFSNGQFKEIDYNDLHYWIPLSELLDTFKIMKEIIGLTSEQIKIYKNDPCYDE